MSIGYTDWQRTLQSVEPVERTRHRDTARIVSLKMEDVVASESWTVFRQHVEALHAEAQRGAAMYMESLASSDLTTDEMTRVRLQLQAARGQMTAFEQVLALPAMLRIASDGT